jgi:CRP-like cAMP-binding protein
MVSPEQLRMYPFFGFLDHEQLAEVAMITSEMTVAADETLFSAGGKADALFFLRTGGVDLFYDVMDVNLPHLAKKFHVGTINPGEVLAISAMVAPHELTTTAVTTAESTLFKIDAAALLDLCAEDFQLAYRLEKQIAQVTMARLHATRILLAAASSD